MSVVFSRKVYRKFRRELVVDEVYDGDDHIPLETKRALLCKYLGEPDGYAISPESFTSSASPSQLDGANAETPDAAGRRPLKSLERDVLEKTFGIDCRL